MDGGQNVCKKCTANSERGQLRNPFISTHWNSHKGKHIAAKFSISLTLVCKFSSMYFFWPVNFTSIKIYIRNFRLMFHFLCTLI